MDFKSPRLIAPIAKKISYVIIVLSATLIVFNIAASAYFHPQRVVVRAINSLAKEYYEDYLYYNLIGSRTGDEIGSELKRYEKTGVQSTYLRQLLLYDSGRRNEASGYFNQNNYTCDENETYVKYYPDPPYGNQDYHFELKLVCE